MKAAVYLRVSTERQEEANQEPDCLRVCAARGWEPVIFRETESGAKRRPVWDSVKRAVHRGEVGGVVVWALDRAGRDRVRLSSDLAELSRKNAVVVSVREPWVDQPTGPLRDLLIEIMAWFAASERARIVERTKAGLARAVAMGRKLGRKPTPQGKVDLLRALHEQGVGAREAGRRVGVAESTARTWYARFDAGLCSCAREGL
jgi:DNA invertase Pin-like site-specific DNA recombinase